MSVAVPAGGIGVFDSGVGGLSVLREIRQQLPAEHVLYVADSAFAPYGDRSENYIEARATAIVRFLLTQQVKAIVVACNTVTGVAIQKLRAWCPVPIVAIEPAIKPATIHTRSGVIGVLATRRTISSESVLRLCAAHGQNVRILLQACPGFVEQVERAEFASTATRDLITQYVKPLLQQGADTLVLGCTHYPFLEALIRDVVGPDVTIVDPSAAVARELARRLNLAGIANVTTNPGREFFWTSGAPQQVAAVIAGLWGNKVDVMSLPVEYCGTD